jgi:hypothetical protein
MPTPTPVESATLLLKLYELRREETLRKARDFFFGFNPKTIEDVQAALMGPNSGLFRMVLTYWDMAATFVVNGAIDQKMFDETSGEYLGALSKVYPFLPQLREMMGSQNYLHNLEQVCKNGPGGIERLDGIRAHMAQILAMLSAQSRSQSA